MSRLLTAILCITGYHAFSQDTIPRKSNDLTIPRMESDNSRFRYNGIPMKEKRAYGLLRDTNDKEIISAITIAKKQKKYIVAGFVAIPLVFTSLLLYSNATQTHGPGLSEKARQKNIKIAAGCGIVFVFTAFRAIAGNSKRNNLNEEAVKIYNEKY